MQRAVFPVRCILFMMNIYLLERMHCMSTQTYFLGSNSAAGFYSAYSSFCPPTDKNFLWVIKGGPGCGKSSFMRKIGSAAEKAGLDVEYVICSGDPDSLDGVYIPERNVAYVDGTTPHVIEANYPGVNSLYLDLGRFYDCTKLQKNADSIQTYTKKYKAKYSEAYAALAVLPRLSLPTELPPSCAKRFHTAVTCKGIVTVKPPFPHEYVSRSELASLLQNAAAEDILYLHPIWTDTVLSIYSSKDHILYTTNFTIPPCTIATNLLQEAKSLHDELEQLYNPCVNFDGVYDLCQQHIANYI